MSGLKHPYDEHERIRAVLFDLDGTLYRQPPLRALMAVELLTLAFTHPIEAPKRWRGLKEYRRAQESLRGLAAGDAAVEQLRIAAARSGMAVADLEPLVSEWMVERPLKYLPFCKAPGLVEFLDFLGARNLKVGLLSDYPPDAKLGALGLAGRFSPVLWPGDPEVGVLKPDPRGFLLASARWRLAPHEVLVVGDRAEVDGAGATAAGMPCVLIGRDGTGQTKRAGQVSFVKSFERLRRVLDDGR